MARLEEKDAVILAELAQASMLSKQEKDEILENASPRAKKIGRVLIRDIRGTRSEQRIADEFRKWAVKNGVFVRRRKAVRAAG